MYGNILPEYPMSGEKGEKKKKCLKKKKKNRLVCRGSEKISEIEKKNERNTKQKLEEK